MYEEYFEHFLPLERCIDEDMISYSNNVALEHSRYVFVKREGKKQYGYCTHCHNKYETPNLRANEVFECPCCKSKCRAKSSGRSRKLMVDESYFVYYKKSIKDPSTVVAIGVYAVRDYRYEYEDVKTKYSVLAFYVFNKNKSVMIKRDCYYSVAGTFYEGTFSKSNSIHSLFNIGHIGNINTCYSRESLGKAIKGTAFQYSTWEHYYYEDMTKFLDFYSKSPCIEYFTKEGLDSLIRDRLAGERTFSTINWKAKGILKALKITRKEFKDFKESKKNLSFYHLYILQVSKKHGWNLSVDEVLQISSVFSYYNDFNRLMKMLIHGNIRKIVKYISKQKVAAGGHFFSAYDVLRTWEDYIKDCEKLNLDTSKDTIVFPKNLYTSHQNTIKQIKVLADEALNKKISKRLDSLRKYSFQFSGIFIRAAKSSNELVEEGKALTHCVGTYAGRYADGTTNILLIRKESDPNKPFYTMELSKGNAILQVRGKKNCKPTKEVEEFIEAFKREKLTKKPKNKIAV